MAIEFRCKKCDKKLKVKDELAGKKIKCPGCGAGTAVPAAASETAGELEPEQDESESIAKLNLKKFKHKAIDPDDEEIDVKQLEGAVRKRKEDEEKAAAKPPPEPLEPIDWVLGFLCSNIGCIYAIVLMVQGKRSRGVKLLMLSIFIQILVSASSAALMYAITQMGQR